MSLRVCVNQLTQVAQYVRQSVMLAGWHDYNQVQWKRARPVVIICVLVGWLIFVVMALVATPVPVLFQRAYEVSVDDPGLIRLRAKIISTLKLLPNLCGLSASHLLQYKRYLVIRNEGLFLEMLNPNVSFCLPPNTTMDERSSMCLNKVTARRVTRCHLVQVHFTTATGDFDKNFTGAVAHCIQHNLDILEGVWPCPHPDDAGQIPVSVEQSLALKTDL